MQVRDFLALYADAVDVVDYPQLHVHDAEVMRQSTIDRLVEAAILGSPEEQGFARWAIWETAAALGIYPDTLYPLYLARGQGGISPDFTLPAFNLRALAYDMAQAVFAAAEQRHAGAFIFGLSRSEIVYTDQSPAEFAAAVLAAAIKIGYRGPVFFQADHVRVNPEVYKRDAQSELAAIHNLIRQTLAAGFYNIDLSASALENREYDTADEQQRLNYRVSADLVTFIRQQQPAGFDVAVGAKIGESGQRNSTEEDLRAFMTGLRSCLSDSSPGLSKLSVQAGTSRGGIVLPDGSVANLAVDFATLLELSSVLRRNYGLAGVVQYGVSTLPLHVFYKFPESETCEVHLATDFQNIMYEHQAFPAQLRQEMYAFLDNHFQSHRQPGMTDEQFYYQERKHALGPFKHALWHLDTDSRAYLRAAWEQRIGFLFDQLGVASTGDLVREYSCACPQHRELAEFMPGS